MAGGAIDRELSYRKRSIGGSKSASAIASAPAEVVFSRSLTNVGSIERASREGRRGGQPSKPNKLSRNAPNFDLLSDRKELPRRSEGERPPRPRGRQRELAMLARACVDRLGVAPPFVGWLCGPRRGPRRRGDGECRARCGRGKPSRSRSCRGRARDYAVVTAAAVVVVASAAVPTTTLAVIGALGLGVRRRRLEDERGRERTRQGVCHQRRAR